MKQNVSAYTVRSCFYYGSRRKSRPARRASTTEADEGPEEGAAPSAFPAVVQGGPENQVPHPSWQAATAGGCPGAGRVCAELPLQTEEEASQAAAAAGAAAAKHKRTVTTAVRLQWPAQCCQPTTPRYGNLLFHSGAGEACADLRCEGALCAAVPPPAFQCSQAPRVFSLFS